MPWVRIDEEFPEHPKVLAAGPLGMAMQVAALCYCNRHLTDGFIPRAAVPKLLNLEGLGMRMWRGEVTGAGEDATWQLVAADLIDAGLWTEERGGYRIHDYHDYQPSREHVLEVRKVRQEAGRKGGQAKSSKQDAKQPASNLLSKREANALAESKPVPVPVPQVLASSGSTEEITVGATTDATLPEQARPVSTDRQVFDFWCLQRGKRSNTRFTPARQRAVATARKAGYSQDDMLDAIRGTALDPWPDRVHQDDLTLLLRIGSRAGTRNNLEYLRDLARDGPSTVVPLTKQRRQLYANHQALDAWAREVDASAGNGVAGHRDQAQRELPRP